MQRSCRKSPQDWAVSSPVYSASLTALAFHLTTFRTFVAQQNKARTSCTLPYQPERNCVEGVSGAVYSGR